jgi:heme exporter protein D
MSDLLSGFSDFMSLNGAAVFSWYTFAVRFVLPVLAIVILYRTGRSLFREEEEPEEWGYLSLPNGAKIPLNHWRIS